MLRYCLGCTARYAPDLATCPQCGSTSRIDAPGGTPDPDELKAAKAAATAKAPKTKAAISARTSAS